MVAIARFRRCSGFLCVAAALLLTLLSGTRAPALARVRKPGKDKTSQNIPKKKESPFDNAKPGISQKEAKLALAYVMELEGIDNAAREIMERILKRLASGRPYQLIVEQKMLKDLPRSFGIHPTALKLTNLWSGEEPGIVLSKDGLTRTFPLSSVMFVPVDDF